METSAPKRRKTSPTEGIPIRGGSTSQPASSTQQHGAASRLRRTVEKPSPRPLPPPPAEDEEPMDPFRGRVLRRSPPRGGVLPRAPPPEEPELPPTPTEKGLSDPSSINTSPLGIHNTPSKRARRSKALAEKLKSSPLKQPPLRPPPDHAAEAEGPKKAPSQPVFSRPRRQEERAEAPVPVPPLSRTHEALHNDDDDDEEAMIAEQLSHPHPARKVPDPDPFAEKKALRDSLVAEVAQLENDIEFASRENARLHRFHQAGKGRRDDWTTEDKGKILDLLRRHILPQAPPSELSKKEEAGSGELLLAALNPISFLPFNKADQPIPPSLLEIMRAATTREESGESSDHQATPVASHYPIPMTAEEELPYLQVFTPLTFTSTVSMLPPRGGEDPDATTMSMGAGASTKPPMQKHVISVASSPPGLFAARLEMTVNTKTLAIVELSVPQLDPSAAGELRPFIERIAHGSSGVDKGAGSSGSNSALTRNVSVVTWAMGEWTRLATRRARFWCAVERELASPEGIARCTRLMRKGGSSNSNNKRRRVGNGDGEADEEDESDDELEDGQDGKKGGSRFSRADLMRYMGRSSFDLDLPGAGEGGEEKPPSVRIQWRIELDWTGEARSKMGLFVAAPAKWHSNGKGRKSLAGIPIMFDQLMGKNVDPMVAVKTIVALLAGDGGRN
ncbi:hypothetical protein SLS62_007278 [Diatrype stigma]|uniref:Uncharacterized protein n=1 Tax=Diatrype stigma TaxID=117547 RepID=A0AAN9UP59_9PEZI